MWSLGVLLYFMLTVELPFGANLEDVQKVIGHTQSLNECLIL